MPNEKMHLSQYMHNKSFLEIEALQITDTKFIDWVITIIFYSAVHLVEKELSAKLSYDSLRHYQREKAINRVVTLRPIASIYHTLYMASIKSRYDCHRYTRDDARCFLNYLNTMEKELL